MGVWIGNSGPDIRGGPDFPHLYYTTGRRICQYLFEKIFFGKIHKKKMGNNPHLSTLPIPTRL